MDKGYSAEWESELVQMDIDGIVHTGPVFLRSLAIGSSSGAGYVTVYDGLNTNGRVKLRLYTSGASTVERRFTKQIKFSTGIYVDFDDTTTTGDFEVWPCRKGPSLE